MLSCLNNKHDLNGNNLFTSLQSIKEVEQSSLIKILKITHQDESNNKTVEDEVGKFYKALYIINILIDKTPI